VLICSKYVSNKPMTTSPTPSEPVEVAPTAKSRKSQSAVATRDRLLQATIHIIQNQGVERLTLDAVAKEAGVSKGGLLYHFASKEALVAGVIQCLIDEFDADIAAELDRDTAPDSPGKWLRAYVNSSFNGKVPPTQFITSLLSAVTVNPELLKPVKIQFEAWQQKILAPGLDPVRACLVSFAADGFVYSEIFGGALPDENLRQELLAMLLGMIQAAESGSIAQ
jgi:AcrR family transcriptional regulator